jgi:hypothetical protein
MKTKSLKLVVLFVEELRAAAIALQRVKDTPRGKARGRACIAALQACWGALRYLSENPDSLAVMVSRPSLIDKEAKP